MQDKILDDIIIRLKLIDALIKNSEINQAKEYLTILTDKYEMNDLVKIKYLTISNEIDNAKVLLSQVIKSYEDIDRINKSSLKLQTQNIYNLQLSKDELTLIPFKKENKWGFKDFKNVLIIESIYDDYFPFQEGKAAVKKDENWGFINIKGDVCSDFIYERVESYYDGMAAVSIRSTNEYSTVTNTFGISKIDNSTYQVDRQYFLKWGFINHDGELVIPIQYENVKRFSEGLAMVETLINYYDGMIWNEKKYKYDFIDKTGDIKIELKNFENSSGWDRDFWHFHNKPFIFNGGRCKVYTQYVSKAFNQDAIINKSGDIIVSNLNYDRIMSYSEGLAAVAHVDELEDSDGEKYFKQKWGFIDINGNEVIGCKFEEVGSFKEGIAPVRLNNKWGFINNNGFVIVSCKFQAVRQFSEGLAAAYQEVPNLDLSTKHKSYKWGFINKAGKTVIPFIYEGYSLSYEEFIPGCFSFKNGRVKVQKDSKWFTINMQGDSVEE
jgi:hypothetical protein